MARPAEVPMARSLSRSATILAASLIALALGAVSPAGAAEDPRWADGDGLAARGLAARGRPDPAVIPAAIAAARAGIAAAPRDPARYRAALTALHADAILASWNAEGPTQEASDASVAALVAPRHEEAVAVGRAWAAALPGEESLLALADLLGQGPEAERVLRRLIDREPHSVAGHEAIARWLRAAGREG